MLLKSVTEGGLISWGDSKQNSCSFATGSFGPTPLLKVFNYDTGYKDTQPTVLGWSEAAAPFKGISWGNFGVDSSYPLGVIAGGLNDGSVVLWDVQSMIDSSGNSENEYLNGEVNYHGLISVIDGLYEGPVTTIEFNPFKPNLIAVGGQDVLVMNIEKDVNQPQIFSPGNPNPHQDHSITSVSWNRKVQHILASASQNGLTVVWDLKINKPIFNFQDSSAILNRKVSLSWNPEIPTQIAVTYDDERVPELQIWDLRNPQGPVVVFSQAHQQGINCLSWCPSDQSLILTSGRDRQVICWNYKTQEMVKQEHLQYDIIDLKWSNKVSGVYACTGSDGHTDVRSLEGSTEGYAPRWFKPPAGARFAPDGSLITFREGDYNLTQYKQEGAPLDPEMESLQRFLKIEGAAHRMESELQTYSDQVFQKESLDQEQREEFEFEHELWKLINVVTRNDQTEYVSALGFSKRDITAQTENYTGKRHNKKEQPDQTKQQTKKQNKGYDFATLSAQDAESFFDQLTTMSIQKEKRENTPGVTTGSTRTFEQQGKEIYAMEQVSRNINWDTGVEKIIKDNLIIGNYDGAIDCALKCGRSAEALLLAYSSGKECFEQTMSTFLTAQTDFFLKSVFKNIVTKQYEEIAKSYDLQNWRECAALVLSTGEKDKQRFQNIMSQLGDRFISEKKDENNALLCFILARDELKSIEILSNQLSKINKRTPNYKIKLIKAYKIISILSMQNYSDSKEFNQINDRISLSLAYKAIELGYPLVAVKVLSEAPQLEREGKVKKLYHLLYHSSLNDQCNALDIQAPSQPFKTDPLNAPKLQPKPVAQQQQPQTHNKRDIFDQRNTQQPAPQPQPQGRPTQNRPQPAVQQPPVQPTAPFRPPSQPIGPPTRQPVPPVGARQPQNPQPQVVAPPKQPFASPPQSPFLNQGSTGAPPQPTVKQPLVQPPPPQQPQFGQPEQLASTPNPQVKTPVRPGPPPPPSRPAPPRPTNVPVPQQQVQQPTSAVPPQRTAVPPPPRRQ